MRTQEELHALYRRGAINPLISGIRPMSEAPLTAAAVVASRKTPGKVLLAPGS